MLEEILKFKEVFDPSLKSDNSIYKNYPLIIAEIECSNNNNKLSYLKFADFSLIHSTYFMRSSGEMPMPMIVYTGGEKPIYISDGRPHAMGISILKKIILQNNILDNNIIKNLHCGYGKLEKKSHRIGLELNSCSSILSGIDYAFTPEFINNLIEESNSNYLFSLKSSPDIRKCLMRGGGLLKPKHK